MGFNSYPALSIKAPDLGQVLATASALKTAQLKNKLFQSKIDKESQAAALRQRALDPTIDERGALGGGTQALGVDTPAMRQLLALDPESGGKLINAIGNMNKQQRETLKQQNGMMARLLMSVEDAPPEQRAMAYAQALGQARQAGLPTGSAPQQYDPQWVHMNIRKGMSIDDILNDREKARKARSDGVWVVNDKGQRRFVRKDELVEQSADGSLRQDKDQTLKLVADPESPTGSKYVTSAEAVGQAGPPKSGLDVEFGPDGKVQRITTGGKGKGGSSGLTKSMTTQIQKDLFATTNTLARLQEVQNSFKPEFLEIGTRVNAMKTAGMEKLGADVSEADKQQLTQFSDFKRNALENINRGIKDLTGAAMTDSEAKRIRGGLPDPGEGLLDGDSPTQFQSKLNSTVRSLRLASARYTHALRNGLDPKNSGISIDGMEKVLRDRQSEIIQAARAEDPEISDDALRSIVVQRLGAEFGLTFGK